jgi:hypothetical protein
MNSKQLIPASLIQARNLSTPQPRRFPRYSCGLLLGFLILNAEAHADVLCVNKKTRAVLARPSACKKGEVRASTISSVVSSTSATAGVLNGAEISLSDTGAVSGGTDSSTGLDVSVSRTGAAGGNISNNGVVVDVASDGGGDSTNVGLMVTASGADTNYSGLFMGGNVGIGVSDPDEILELAGRLHLGQTSAPSVTTDKLYNVGGSLYWAGQEIAFEGGGGSSGITSITAGTGLSGGGSSGAVSLSVNAGTSANQIVQLNGSGQLPAVSGQNLTALNATNISSGTLSDSRLSTNVSLLGSSINLSSEVTGTLAVSAGGTGATSLSNLIALSTHTTGNYVASVATTSGISGGAAASEGAALSLSIDPAYAGVWTSTHSFQDKVNVGTSSSSAEALHLNGRLHMEQAAAPSVTTDKLYNVAGELYFNGLNLSANALGGDITGVTAGTGLTGGGTSGALTLAVDVGTSANDIVQLNGSSQLPAVSGVNLTNLNATALTSGTVPDARLSSNVTQLGSSIGLTTEVTGTLPVANGGTGATSLTNLIALGTHTTGNYLVGLSGSSGITTGSTGTEALTGTIALDQSFAPTWTAAHTFSGISPDLVTPTGEDFAIMPGTGGLVGIGVTSPSAMLDAFLSSSASSAATQKAGEFTIQDTGVVSSGTDTTYGLDVLVNRTGANSAFINSTGINVAVNADTNGTSSATGLNVSVAGADTNYAALFSGGFVGVGNVSPVAQLDVVLGSTATSGATERGLKLAVTDTGLVSTGADTTYGLEIDLSRTGSTGGTTDSTGLDVSVIGDSGGSATTSTVGLNVAVSGADTNVAAKFSGGSVSVGGAATVSHANIPAGSLVLDSGALCVDDGGNNCDDVARTAGGIYAESTSLTGIDLAEEFPIESDSDLQPGELVMIATQKAAVCVELAKGAEGSAVCAKTTEGIVPFVRRSDGIARHAKRVIGVVSTAPGVVLGGMGRDEIMLYRKVPVALAGRIPVKVSLENGPIELGDRLSIAKIPGFAAKALEGEEIIGIALEERNTELNEPLLVLVK